MPTRSIDPLGTAPRAIEEEERISGPHKPASRRGFATDAGGQLRALTSLRFAALIAKSKSLASKRIVVRTLAVVLSLLFLLDIVQPETSEIAHLGLTNLDGSWRLGLTMAALGHLRFGQDLIFTFGPLGYVLEGVPHPMLARSAALGSLLIVVFAIVGCWLVCSRHDGIVSRVMVITGFAVAAAADGLDYVAYTGVLFFLGAVADHRRQAVVIALVIAAVCLFGFLSKLTLGFATFATASVYWLFEFAFGICSRRRAALISLAALTIVVAGGLLAAFGWSLNSVAQYLVGATEISAGYSSAMSLPGPALEALIAAGIAAIIAGAALVLPRDNKALGVAIIVAVFLAWKHGFVRADWHALHFFCIASVAAPLVAMAENGRTARLWGALAMATATVGLSLTGIMFHGRIAALFRVERVALGARYLLAPVPTAAEAQQRTTELIAGDKLSDNVKRRIGTASVDVLPGETAIVYANQLRWSPLPVFQSYSAYTPRLDYIDRDALTAHGADLTLFRYWDLDERYPLASEPATFMELICRYRLGSFEAATPASGAFMVLNRQRTNSCKSSPEPSITVPATLNTSVAVPKLRNPGDMIEASLDLAPTLFGKVATLVWRAPMVVIEVHYRDGTRKSWRLIAATVSDGLLVSPMPRDQKEANVLFSSRPHMAAAVESIRVVAPERYYALKSVRFRHFSNRRTHSRGRTTLAFRIEAVR
ncbi:membrane protein [Vulcanimicrobium alpinum]|uniref:Membrane protein n=1 Tax=Vulcanimicrobium alpinum TaxID=3016050 RepID=A0AAN1XY06_UNVUL|nr:hypothetical protein [Vulcanimicrobium alpinum]BDE07000.1 membrane protein [Vulcanimicrobium alpinum]